MEEGDTVEIVLLLNEVVWINADRLFQIYRNDLQIDFKNSSSREADYIVEAPPAFLIQYNGTLLSLITMPGIFGSKEGQVLCPYHDHSVVRSSLGLLQKLRFGLHQSWLSMTWLRTEPVDATEPYVHVTQFLLPFLPLSTCIVHPPTNRARILTRADRKSRPQNLLNLL